mgnify:CR=1 FL=1
MNNAIAVTLEEADRMIEVAARSGTLTPHEIPAASKNLYIWADIIGVEAGDSVTVRLFGPGDKLIKSIVNVEPATKQRIFHFADVQNPQGWEPGPYKAEIVVIPRGGGFALHNFARREVTLR